jgi:hypothetical protein
MVIDGTHGLFRNPAAGKLDGRLKASQPIGYVIGLEVIFIF